MSKSVFRKASLDRLSSPEQLDQVMTVTSPRAWLALLAIGAILLAVLVWGIWGSIPSKTYGQGILLTSGGVHDVTHISSGRVTDIRVRQGEMVRTGDVLARIEQQDLVEEINRLKIRLADLERVEQNLPQYQEAGFQEELFELYDMARQLEDAAAQVSVMEARYREEAARANLNRFELERALMALEEARIRADEQQTEVDRLQQLYEAGAVSMTEWESAVHQLDLLEINVDQAQQSVDAYPSQELAALESLRAQEAELEQVRLQVRLMEAELEDRRKRLESSTAREMVELNRQIESLQQELQHSTTIVAGVSGRILETRISQGSLVQPGMSLFSIVEEGADLRDLQGILYVPADKGKQIIPGMEAQISPGTVKKEEYGYMLGRVVSVSQYPATAQGMMLTLGNEELVRQLAGQSSPIEVRIELVTNPNTPSGYQWSTPQGPPMVIDTGTISTGSVTVRTQRPIHMIIPRVRGILPFI